MAPSSLGRQDEGLARYPHLKNPGGILRGFDYIGTVTFALSGSLTAAQSGLDVFGCCMVGMITAVGGGTIRDSILLGKRPFWTYETEYIWMTIITSFITFFSWPFVIDWKEKQQQQQEQEQQQQQEKKESDKDDDDDEEEEPYDNVDAVLDTFDSIALAAFAVIGAQNGVRAGTRLFYIDY